MIYVISALVIFLTTFILWYALFRGQQQSDRRHSFNVYKVENEDVEMNEAIRQAKESIELFIVELKAARGPADKFELKVKFEEEGQNEHLWLKGLSYDNGFFRGVIANEPVVLKEYSYGQEVMVSYENVTDWMIIDNGLMRGGFTIKALLKKMTEEERKSFLEQLEFKIA